MLYRSYRRSSLTLRLLRLLLYLLLAWLVFDILIILKQHREFSRNLVAHTYTSPALLPSPLQNQRIFIVAQFWTNAYVIYYRWGQALIDLVGVLGRENVFVSIYESGSLDNTKDILKDLGAALVANGIAHEIVLDPTTHADEIDAGPYDENGKVKEGWIETTTEGTKYGKEFRRIPFLAKSRNLSLRPLHKLRDEGHSFDKILFLNDVVFKPSDVLSLLATNQGSYSAACALDFHYPPAYYDTFALRDSDGLGTIQTHFPYFRSRESREAIMQGNPAKVASCWNGMIVMDSSPFYDGLQFRGLGDNLATKHLEASECCLIHTDMNVTSPGAIGRIYVNPAVRVGYTIDAYNETHFGEDQNFVSPTQYIQGVWTNRLRRNILPLKSEILKGVEKKVAEWRKEAGSSLDKSKETGDMCVIDEQHILIWNGWKHVGRWN
jgi:hypothetical protein